REPRRRARLEGTIGPMTGPKVPTTDPKTPKTDPKAPTTQTAQPKGPDHQLVQEFRLVVVKGNDKKAQHTASNDQTVIGTHESASSRLSAPTMSRFHCKIELKDGKAFVHDLGSRNGTTVNGVTVMNARLDDGAILGLGDTDLKFQLRKEHFRIPLSVRE